MNTTIKNPEVKRLIGVVLNAAVKANDSDCYILDCNALNGDTIGRLFVGDKLFAKADALIGKCIDVVYKDCIAGETQYIDEDDVTEEIKFHETTHKQVLDIVKTNDINLLIACSKSGIREMYNDLKELQK